MQKTLLRQREVRMMSSKGMIGRQLRRLQLDPPSRQRHALPPSLKRLAFTIGSNWEYIITEMLHGY